MRKNPGFYVKAAVVTAALIAQSFVTTIPSRAAGKDASINMGITALAAPDQSGQNAAWSGDYVYFGNYYQDQKEATKKQPVKWRVLDPVGTYGSSSEAGAVLLQSDLVLDRVAFNEDADALNARDWQQSNLANWLNSTSNAIYKTEKYGEYTAGGFYNTAFSKQEKEAIISSDGCKDENVSKLSTYPITDYTIGGRKMFCLSIPDMVQKQYGFQANTSSATSASSKSRIYKATAYAKAKGAEEGTYGESKGNSCGWLRSGLTVMGEQDSGVVGEIGNIGLASPDTRVVGVIPAMNVKKEDVLFTSPAEAAGEGNGKAETFTKVTGTDGNTWKFTLKDSRSFADGTVAKVKGQAVTNHYIGVKAGAVDTRVLIQHKALKDISSQYTNVTAALVSDSDQKIVCYGSIQTDTSATSSQVTLPEDLAQGTYQLQIYAEDQNGARETDYATGTPYTVTVEVMGNAGHQHHFGDWKNTKDCTQGGTQKRSCTICGYEEQKAAPQQEHEWENTYTVDQKPTCTTPGRQSIHCKNCTVQKDVTSIPANGHRGGYASCSERAICKVCNQPYGEYSAHQYNTEKWQADAGAHWHGCKVCTARKDIAIHEWDRGVIIDDSIKADRKLKVYTCTICGMQKTEILSGETPANPTPGTAGNDPATGTTAAPAGQPEQTTAAPAGQSAQTTATPAGQPEQTTTAPAGQINQTPAHTVAGQIVQAAQTQEPSATDVQQTAGEEVVQSDAVYRILQVATREKKGQVAYVHPVNRKAAKVEIADTVSINGMPYAITQIEKRAFYNNKKLKTAVLGKNVKKIGAKAFYNCRKLQTLKIRTTRLTASGIGAKAFAKAGAAGKKLKVSMPAKQRKLYKKIFTKKGLRFGNYR